MVPTFLDLCNFIDNQIIGELVMEQDFFRDIAMTKHPLENTDKEIEPRELSNIFFENTTILNKKVVLKEEIPYDERVQHYKESLKALRETYKPFMENNLKEHKSLKELFYLKEFQFRYLDGNERFTDRDKNDNWEQIKIPDYRGPVDENGKWRAYYKSNFKMDLPTSSSERVIIRFQCVDYKAFVYLNGNYIGSHEGFFAPFEFDITDYLEEENELIIECQNDYTILGIGPVLDGDKIYGATGPGFDDPYSGWHHCPAGAGVFGKVSIETRPTIYIEDIFVRPNIDNNTAEIRIGITNYTDVVKEDYKIHIRMLPKNYIGNEIGEFKTTVYYIGIGKNEYRYVIPLHDYKLWELESPYLYGAVVELTKEDNVVSKDIGTFGMKKLISDESTLPKGKFYFNNRPFVLRGANEMGHLQQSVMNDDYEQLIDDILIAKLCNLNYYRITQRPVQEEIYDYFDMLGMMHQCDFPLFGFLRRNQFCEAIRQVEEMEHLIRRHVSTVMVTFINEPMCIRKTQNPQDKYSKRYHAKGHRHLLRDELEAFFVAARKTIYVQNPDRVIKNVEGDYDPPTSEGMPDFHCYTMWYTNHGEPIGRLLKGYLPPVKQGWMIGCGEYGAEGLDNENIMLERYPKEWIEIDEFGHWYPDKIRKAQTFASHGDWYKEQNTMTRWVSESQKHQAIATKLMTDAFRRRADVINHTAIHLLIDAWPSGWMKTLVCCDRIPKLAYFSYMDSLEKLRVNLYTDRRYVYDDEIINVEAWLLNDTSSDHELTIYAELVDLDSMKTVDAFRLKSSVDAASSVCAGKIPVSFKAIDKKTTMRLVASILNDNEEAIYSESIELQVYPRFKNENKIEIQPIGNKAKSLVLELGQSISDVNDTCICSDLSEEALEKLSNLITSGGHGILLLPNEPVNCKVLDVSIKTKGKKEVFFVATEKEERNLSMLYNKEKDYIDFIGRYHLEADKGGKELVYTYGKGKENERIKEKRPYVVQYKLGDGTLTVISLLLEGRVSCNPNLDELLIEILERNLG